MNNRRGCLSGLLELMMLRWLFDWLQGTFGFGRRNSCLGMGCGMILLIIFVILACSILSSTDWGRLGLHFSGFLF